MKLSLEIEAKIPVRELSKYEEILMSRGAKFIGIQHQVDIYFQHPCRDFRLTDEALRVRLVNDKVYLTYKGSRREAGFKARPEVEVRISDYSKIVDILNNLGFKYVAKIEKIRKMYEIDNVVVSLDDVYGLGKFIEVEVRNYGNREKAIKRIERIIKLLRLPTSKVTTKSYLEVLLEKDNR